ncbi:MAG: ABC transporter permease [Fimbriimonadaceae bacterium]|nr:ABC transporter permease [Fimbriimonadaceae bacterium]
MRANPLSALLRSREARTLALIIVVLVIGAMKEPRLISPSSISSMILWIPLLTVMAVGQMFVIVSRGIDVSVGSILGLSGIIVGMLFRSNPEMSIALGAGLSLGVGATLGLINGSLIAFVKIPPIITTLGTLSAYRGLVFIISGGEQVNSNHIPTAITDWSKNGPVHIGGVTLPWLIIFALLAAVLGHIFAHRTTTGRNLYAIGSHPEAAHLRGVPVRRSVLLAYVLCGALAGFAGILYMSRFGFVNPGSVGQGYELTVIAATVIGGCDVRGGSGSVLGVVLGCVLLGVVNVALAVLGIAADWQVLVYGAVILLALGFDALMGRRRGEAFA